LAKEPRPLKGVKTEGATMQYHTELPKPGIGVAIILSLILCIALSATAFGWMSRYWEITTWFYFGCAFYAVAIYGILWFCNDRMKKGVK
jgi:hypothetical protein